mgnify:CR=1 FL=1
MTLEYITEKNAPTEAEIVQYMKLPLVLFKTAEFKEELSLAAKVLYCFLLDRSNLSLKNADRFTDKNGRAFVYFSWDEAMDTLQCARQKQDVQRTGAFRSDRKGGLRYCKAPQDLCDAVL